MLSGLITASASAHDEAARYLVDGDFTTRWRSHQPQATNMHIDLTFPGPMEIEGLRVYYHDYPHDRANAVTVLVRDAGNWKRIAARIPEQLDAFDFSRGFPVWGNWVQTIPLPPSTARTVRIRIAEPREGRDWTISEIAVYLTADSDSARAPSARGSR